MVGRSVATGWSGGRVGGVADPRRHHVSAPRGAASRLVRRRRTGAGNDGRRACRAERADRLRANHRARDRPVGEHVGRRRWLGRHRRGSRGASAPGPRSSGSPLTSLRRFRLRRRPFAIRHLGCRLGLEQLMGRRRRPEGHRPGVVDRRRRWAGRPGTQPVQLDALAVVYTARRPRHRRPTTRSASGRSVLAMTSSVRSTSAAARAGDDAHGPRLEAAAVALARPTCTVTVTSSPEPSGRRDHANSVAPLPAATRAEASRPPSTPANAAASAAVRARPASTTLPPSSAIATVATIATATTASASGTACPRSSRVHHHHSLARSLTKHPVGAMADATPWRRSSRATRRRRRSGRPRRRSGRRRGSSREPPWRHGPARRSPERACGSSRHRTTRRRSRRRCRP